MLNTILIIGMLFNLAAGYLLVAKLDTAASRQDSSETSTSLLLEWDHAQLYLMNAEECCCKDAE